MDDCGGLPAFCRQEWPRLVGALSLYTGEPDLAEELAQETLARVCRDWGKVSRMAAPGAWAYRVALNLAKSNFRRRGVARRHVERAPRQDEALDFDREATLEVRAAIARLPHRLRTVVVLRYYIDLPVREVAEAMGCPEGTVKTLTRQALAELRTLGLVGESEEDKEPTDA